jgi:type II secretion system protein I
MRGRTSRRGLTLIEVLVAMSLVAVATLALVSANTIATRTSARAYRHHVAMRLAQQRLNALILGSTKQKLNSTAQGTALKPDGTALDCKETGMPSALCDGSVPDQVGWVDVYGRPCRRTGDRTQGMHPTCQYRRYLRYEKQVSASGGDLWRVFVAVSHEPEGKCKHDKEGDAECVVISAILTR